MRRVSLAAALDAFGVDEVLAEVLDAAVPHAVLRTTKRYLALSATEGGPVLVYVHRTRLLITLPQLEAQDWSTRLGTVHDQEAAVTHLVVKSAELADPRSRHLAISLLSTLC